MPLPLGRGLGKPRQRGEVTAQGPCQASKQEPRSGCSRVRAPRLLLGDTGWGGGTVTPWTALPDPVEGRVKPRSRSRVEAVAGAHARRACFWVTAVGEGASSRRGPRFRSRPRGPAPTVQSTPSGGLCGSVLLLRRYLVQCRFGWWQATRGQAALGPPASRRRPLVDEPRRCGEGCGGTG